MLIKDLKDCPEFTAGDKSTLKELLHPSKQDINLRYSLAYAVVKPGQSTKPHILKTSEVYYITEGEGEMHINDEVEKVRSGQAIYIPPNSKQHIINTGKSDLKFLCIVDPAWKKGDESILSEK